MPQDIGSLPTLRDMGGKTVRGHAKLGKAAQARVSAKIAHLRREGKPAKQAAGEAYGMEREHRLMAGGGYKRATKKR